MAECFPAGGVLLVSVSEGDVYPSLHVIRGTFRGGSALGVSVAEGGVAEAERLAVPTVGGGRAYSPGWQRKKKPRTQRSIMALARLGSG